MTTLSQNFHGYWKNGELPKHPEKRPFLVIRWDSQNWAYTLDDISEQRVRNLLDEFAQSEGCEDWDEFADRKYGYYLTKT